MCLLRECRLIRTSASGLLNYYTALVCVPAVLYLGGLAVWQQLDQKNVVLAVWWYNKPN